MFGLHPDTVESLKNCFYQYDIAFTDNYTRWGRRESYTCLAILVPYEFWTLVKLFTIDVVGYAEDHRLSVETVQVQMMKLMRIMERTAADPDRVFPDKTDKHTVYYFPEIHLED